MKKFLSPMRRKLLDFIGSSPTGRTFGEIQRFVVEDLHGFNYDEKQDGWKWDKVNRKYVSIPDAVRRHRGYWCVNLCGSSGIFW